MNLLAFFKKLCRNNRGATAIEYGLILVMIVIAIVSAVQGLANKNSGMWAFVSSETTQAISGSSS